MQSAAAQQFAGPPQPILTGQWFVGAGGGASFLQPNPVDPAIENGDDQGSYTGIVIGRDLSELTSLQLQLHALDEIALSSGHVASYQAFDASLLYRFFDSRDRQLRPTPYGAALYGLAGLGKLSRDIEPALALKNRKEIYLNYGLGAEFFINRHISFRLQAAVLEEDAQITSLSLVTRFGANIGQSRAPVNPPAAPGTASRAEAEASGKASGTLTDAATVPESATAGTASISAGASAATIAAPMPTPGSNTSPATETQSAVPADQPQFRDSDQDGVTDALDECPSSAVGYPVRENGCALFNGVLRAVKFASSSAILRPDSQAQLDALARVLKQYPESRIQLLAHTDASLDETEQAILTRGRIRTIGLYLQSRGIRASRLMLRSMGGAVPVSDNSTGEGRIRNNRIEILEYH